MFALLFSPGESEKNAMRVYNEFLKGNKEVGESDCAYSEEMIKRREEKVIRFNK